VGADSAPTPPQTTAASTAGCTPRNFVYPWGFATRTPLHTLSLAASAARSVCVARIASLTRGAFLQRGSHRACAIAPSRGYRVR
jgi:hypothetical protein